MVIPKFKKLHDKVLHLSVSIEDNTKSIVILQGAIQDTVESIGQKHTKTNAKYRVLFDGNATNYEVRLAVLLGSCSKLVKQKEELTETINGLIEDKKEEEKKTDIALKHVYTETQNDIRLRRQKWKSDEKERRSRWMAENVERVRRDTIKALEPEIKSLIHKNKVEVGNIESEFKTKKHYLEKEKEISLQLKIREYLKTANEKREYKTAERKDCWEEQLSELKRTNLREVDKSKKDYLNLKEGEKSCENSKIQTLIEEYDSSITSIQKGRAREIEKARNEHAMRRNNLIGDHQDKLLQLSKEDTEKKSKWEEETKVSMREVKVEELIIMKEGILQRRNKDIDDLIRTYNQMENSFRLHCEEQLQNSKKGIEDAHKEDVTNNREEIVSLRDKLSQSYDKIERLRIENQKTEDKVEAEEGRAKNIEPQIVAERIFHCGLKGKLSNDIGNINVTKRNLVVGNLSKQQMLSDDIKMLKEKITSYERCVV